MNIIVLAPACWPHLIDSSGLIARLKAQRDARQAAAS
jgi:hypothetical protein